MIKPSDVFISMLNKIMSKDPAEISRIIDLVLLQITTNIDLAKYMPLIPEFIANKDTYLSNIVSVMIPKVEYSKEILERGSYIYVTEVESFLFLFKFFMLFIIYFRIIA